MLMIGKELTAQQRLHKAVVDIMAHDTHMAVGPVLMIGDKKITPTHPQPIPMGLTKCTGRSSYLP